MQAGIFVGEKEGYSKTDKSGGTKTKRRVTNICMCEYLFSPLFLFHLVTFWFRKGERDGGKTQY